MKLIKFKKQEDVEKFLKELDQRNIIQLDNDRETFEFTKVVDLFFEFAKEIAERKLKSMKNK